MIVELMNQGETPQGYLPGLMTDIAHIAIMKKYGGDCIIEGVWKHKSPRLFAFNIGLAINLSSHEENDFYVNVDEFIDELVACKERGVPIIFIPLRLAIDGSLDNSEGHQNLLIFRVFENTIELFEPNGNTKSPLYKNLHAELKELIDYINPDFDDKLIFLGRDNIFPGRGFQKIESEIPKLKPIEKYGYCSMWSCFFMEMVYLNPTKTSREIADEISFITKDDPTYMRRIIRGYVIQTEKLLKELVNRITSTEFSFTIPFDSIAMKQQDQWFHWIEKMAEESNKIKY
jgi:hypothetical protein